MTHVDRIPTDAFVHHNGLLVSPRWLQPLRRAGLDTLKALEDAGSPAPLAKPGLEPWRERVRIEVEDDSGVSRVLFMKRFIRPPATALRKARRHCPGAASLAGVEWHWLRSLAETGIPVAEPVLLGSRGEGGRELSLVVTASVAGESLETLVRRWTVRDRALMMAVADTTADVVARLHAAGFVHRDLYLSHLFLDPGSDPASPRLALIDLFRVRRVGWRPMRWIVKDLAALHYSLPAGLLSRSDRLRWLKRYVGASKLSASLNGLVRRIDRRAHRMARHDRHRLARIRES